MILEKIKRDVQKYKNLTGDDPERVYVGLRQAAELAQHISLSKPLFGMQIHRTHDESHLNLVGGV